MIPSFSSILVPIGIALHVPKCLYGRIATRSGLSINHSIDIGGGVINNGFRGGIKVIMVNNSNGASRGEKGMKVAQIIFEKFELHHLVEQNSLNQTTRDCQGFGSTDWTRKQQQHSSD